MEKPDNNGDWKNLEKEVCKCDLCKPDFEALANKKCPFNAYPEAWGGFMAACEHVWDTYVLDRDAKIERLESENKALQDKLKESEHLKELAQYDTVNLQKEVERLKDEVRLVDDAYLNLKNEVDRLNSASDRERDRIVEGFLKDQRDNSVEK